MDALKAHRLGVNPSDVRITCELGRYSNDWIAWVPDDRNPRGKHVLRQGGIYMLCRWLRDLRRLTEEDA